MWRNMVAVTVVALLIQGFVLPSLPGGDVQAKSREEKSQDYFGLAAPLPIALITAGGVGVAALVIYLIVLSRGESGTASLRAQARAWAPGGRPELRLGDLPIGPRGQFILLRW